MSYVIKYKAKKSYTGNHFLYYVSHRWYQDSPGEGGTKVFRTVFLADAMFFGDRQEAEMVLDELTWTRPDTTIEYVTDNELGEAKRHKFKETLAGNYIGTK